MEDSVVQELTRLPDWRVRLAAALHPLTGEPFSWAANDCASGLACAVVKAITGTDLKEGWPAYKTARGAADALRRRGYSDLRAAMEATLPEIPKLYARVGDLALLKTTGGVGYALGMVNGAAILAHTDAGLGHCSWDDVVKVFEVGSYEKAPAN